jgi:hypothetical protein
VSSQKNGDRTREIVYLAMGKTPLLHLAALFQAHKRDDNNIADLLCPGAYFESGRDASWRIDVPVIMGFMELGYGCCWIFVAEQLVIEISD